MKFAKILSGSRSFHGRRYKAAAGKKRSRPIFLFFLIALICFLLSSGYLSVRLLREEIQRRSHELNVQMLSEQIEHIIRARLDMLLALSQNQLVIDVFENRIAANDSRLQIAINTVNEVANAEMIYLINNRGIGICGALTDGPSPAGYNYSFRPYFQRSLIGETVIFPAVGVVSKTRGIHLSAPVYGSVKNQSIGVVALKIWISEVENLLNEKEEKIAIYSPDGVIFFSNQKKWVLKKTRRMSSREKERLKRTRQFGDVEKEPLELDIEREDSFIDGIHYIAARSLLNIVGWQIVSFQKMDENVALPDFYMYLVGTSLGVIGGLAILVFFLLANIFRRRKSDYMLRQAEEKYRGIFENAIMGIFQSTIDGRFKEVSPSMAEILGFESPATLMSRINNIGDQIYLDPRDRTEFLRTIIKNKEIKGFQARMRRNDAREIWVALSGRIVSNLNPEETIIEGFCVDITERKQAEEALSRERDIFARVMETSPAGITLMTADGRITFANQKAQELLGLKKDPENSEYFFMPAFTICDFEGNHLCDDQLPAPDIFSANMKVFRAQYALNWSGKKQIFLSVSIAPVFNDQGKVVELVSIFEDITEKIRTEEEAERQKQKLIMVDRMISMGTLASGVAHEINNPNTFILINAQLLADAWKKADAILDDHYQENGDFLIGSILYSKFRVKLPTICGRVIDGSRRIKRIVEELRHFSRKESTPVLQPININQVIRSAEILLANMIKKSTAQFVREIDDAIPLILGNSLRLEQVIINILQNACQALPDETGKIVVSTRYEATSDCVTFECRDDGVGIDEKELNHVCDPFYSTKRESGGTGLGLSISSTIVQEHRGTLEITSRRGEGTCVGLKFPAQKDASENMNANSRHGERELLR